MVGWRRDNGHMTTHPNPTVESMAAFLEARAADTRACIADNRTDMETLSVYMSAKDQKFYASGRRPTGSYVNQRLLATTLAAAEAEAATHFVVMAVAS